MSVVDWLEQYLLPCPSKFFFGMDCPGCGMQRSALALFRGNFVESLTLYPALLPMLFTLVFLGLHLRYKFPNGARTLQYSYFFATLIAVTSYIVKQVQLFNP